ncbi:hypothetical protein J437_LFUL010684 [Ladona fulva]|uniref:Uncharacterized protein n=1 Tax=Ladona fulva TaxID=123851 RepID=A0A8K0K7V0_LADFU|nr:hypothetical protein J437_LFUL010684 [Ladona fulva]
MAVWNFSSSKESPLTMYLKVANNLRSADIGSLMTVLLFSIKGVIISRSSPNVSASIRSLRARAPIANKLFCKTLGTVCSAGYLGCSAYVICLGVIGTVFAITDVFRIIQGGRTLRDDIWRRRYARDRIVSHHFERDLKLITSILGAEHYMCLILGATYHNSTFLLPWLMLQGLVILMEVAIFFARLLCGGVHLFKGEVIINALLFHNWLQVLCFYHGLKQ